MGEIGLVFAEYREIMEYITTWDKALKEDIHVKGDISEALKDQPNYDKDARIAKVRGWIRDVFHKTLGAIKEDTAAETSEFIKVRKNFYEKNLEELKESIKAQKAAGEKSAIAKAHLEKSLVPMETRQKDLEARIVTLQEGLVQAQAKLPAKK